MARVIDPCARMPEAMSAATHRPHESWVRSRMRTKPRRASRFGARRSPNVSIDIVCPRSTGETAVGILPLHLRGQSMRVRLNKALGIGLQVQRQSRCRYLGSRARQLARIHHLAAAWAKASMPAIFFRNSGGKWRHAGVSANSIEIPLPGHLQPPGFQRQVERGTGHDKHGRRSGFGVAENRRLVGRISLPIRPRRYDPPGRTTECPWLSGFPPDCQGPSIDGAMRLYRYHSVVSIRIHRFFLKP